MQFSYGSLVRVLYWGTHQCFTRALEEMELTPAQGHVMGFLSHQDQPPCPRDVEEALHLTHPTVSGILSRLEQKGFVELKPDAADRRCKRIYVCAKGQACHQHMKKNMQQIEGQMVQDFTPQEQEQFARLLQRAIANMGIAPDPTYPKEEE